MFVALLFAIFLGVTQSSWSLAAIGLAGGDDYALKSNSATPETTAIPAPTATSLIPPPQGNASANDVANLRQGPGTPRLRGYLRRQSNTPGDHLTDQK